MHDFYKARNVKDLQKKLFRREYLPEYAMNAQDAQYAFIRGQGELVTLDEIEGRIALEGPCPIRRASSASYRANAGRRRLFSISRPLKKALTNFPDLPRKSKASIWKKRTMAASMPTATS